MAIKKSSAKSFPSMSSSIFKGSNRSLRKLTTRLGSGLLALGLSISVAIPPTAADPFRPTNGAAIGPLTENAFEAIFKEGDYVKANTFLAQAETEEADEPLVHAMLASMAYLKGDEGLSEVLVRAEKTEDTARALTASDPLRGHLYTAVGIFLKGAHVLKTKGVAEGTPEALGMLQEVFSELDAAEAIDPEDAELNLLKGYMDLMLAVNLPFSNPDDAISRMSQYGSPDYLTYRGIAIGYRDLDQFDNALESVDRALAAASSNPELYYLKAQLLVRQGNPTDSIEWFKKALELKEQLPDKLQRQILWEECNASDDERDCAALVGYD